MSPYPTTQAQQRFALVIRALGGQTAIMSGLAIPCQRRWICQPNTLDLSLTEFSISLRGSWVSEKGYGTRYG